MSEAESPELPRGIALAWGVAANPQRGPKREMSIERIVEVAVTLADAEGIGAVSMAAVAAKLGFTPMSLYRYVSAKDDLLLLMQEAATGLPSEAIREAEGWRTKLSLMFQEQVQIYLRHPWILTLPISGTPITPNSSAWLDTGLEALAALPITEDERIGIALLVTGHARWSGMVFAGYSDEARKTGRTDEEVSAQESLLLDAVISEDEFPALRRAIDAGVFVSTADPFQFGIERVLDGVAEFISRRIDSGVPAEEAAAPADAADAGAGGSGDSDEAELLTDKRYREAQKAVLSAEKAVRAARKVERQTRREALERLSR
ncbi:MAG: TetR/AcrR family transcriptional regulator [Leucobacter sp.]